MAKLREGQNVVFNFNGVNRLGTIENISIENKTKRYSVRDEAGRLYAPIGINTVSPGRIDLTMTDAYFGKKKDQPEIGSEGLVDETTTSDK